jgi:iron(III) transport system permease protein
MFTLIPIVPLVIPPLMGAAGWAFLLSPSVGYLNGALRAVFGLSQPGPFDIYTLPGIIFVVTIYLVPYTHTAFFPALRAMDTTMEEAAYISGAGRLTAAWTVTLGLLRPAFLNALILAVVVSAAQFAVPQMLSGGRFHVLTTEIYWYMNTFPSNSSAASAISLLILVPSMVLLSAQYWLLRRGSYVSIGGKGGNRQPIRDPLIRAVSTALLMLYALVALVLPMVGITLVAFQPFWSATIQWDKLTLANFEWVFGVSQAALQSIRTSLVLGVGGATASVLLGFLVAYVALRSRSREARALDFIALLPAGIPATVLGVGFLLAFSRPPLYLYGTLWVLLVAYLVIFLPHAVRPVSAAIRQVSTELEDASRVHGGSWLWTMGRVTVPLVLPSMIGSWVLLFVLLSREVSASVFLITPGVRVIGTTLFDLWENGRGPAMAAFSLVVLVTCALFIVAANAVSLRFGSIGRQRGSQTVAPEARPRGQRGRRWPRRAWPRPGRGWWGATKDVDDAGGEPGV